MAHKASSGNNERHKTWSNSSSHEGSSDSNWESDGEDTDGESWGMSKECSKVPAKPHKKAVTEAEFISALNRDFDIDFHMMFGIDLKYDYDDPDDDDLKLPAARDCQYTSCYCEENVWMLCNYVRLHQPDKLDYIYAVFISNDNKEILMWEQKAGRGSNNAMFWDYHVIFLYRKNKRCAVFDLDSCLPFPSDFRLYASRAIRTNKKILPKYHRKVRVIPAVEYLENFSSDRSHMKREDGSWIHPPPPYPCIQKAKKDNNLQKFISMNSRVGMGKVMSIQKFFREFMPPPRKPKA